jgi:hypothetical protein
VYFDYQVSTKPQLGSTSNVDIDVSRTSWVPDWLLNRLGEEFFHEVLAINMVYNDDGAQRLDNKLQTDDIKMYLPAFPRLKLLLLYEGQATDECLKAIGQLSHLERLYLWDARTVTDKGVAHLSNLRKVKYIHLSFSNISDESLRTFGTMKQLEGLSLQGNRFTDVGLEHLKDLPELTSLAVDLGPTHITDAGLAHLHGLKKLRDLMIQRTQVTNEGIARLQQALPGIQVSR